MQSLWQDVRFATRLLIRGRWFTLAAIVALALGIGANNTVFTIVNAVLLRPLPFDRAEQIMFLDTHDVRGRQFGVSLLDFDDWRRASHSFSGMAVVFNGSFNLSGDDQAPEQVQG